MNEDRELAPPSPELVARLREEAERRLSPEEFEAYVQAPMSEAELESIRELSKWFCRRYPTPEARLAYVRRAHARSRSRLAGGP